MTKGIFVLNSLLVILVFSLKIIASRLQTALAKLFKMEAIDADGTLQQILAISHHLSSIGIALAIISVIVAGILVYNKSWNRTVGGILLGVSIIGLLFSVATS